MKSKKNIKNKKDIFEYIKKLKNIKIFFANKEISLIKKVQVIFLLLMMTIYLISPIDIVPDFIPVFGYFEDVIVAFSMLSYVGSIIEKQLRAFGEEEKNDKVKKQEVIDVKFTEVEENKKDPE
ncbi:MAG: YkvA family protein [Proteocatella sp.]